MGFHDFQINYKVLERAKGNFEYALSLLVGEAKNGLGQSVFV
jgi:hypothetical protein